MYIVKDLPPQIEASRLELLAKAEPATIGHTLHSGFMDIGMRGILPDVRIAGTAVTVRNTAWNGALTPNATTTFGFLGSGNAGNAPTAACQRS